MKKVRSLLRQWAFNLFVWRIEVKLKRLDGDDRILYLANALMDECERQGYDTEFHHPDCNLRSVDVSHFTDRTTDNFKVGNINNDWEVRGNRKPA